MSGTASTSTSATDWDYFAIIRVEPQPDGAIKIYTRCGTLDDHNVFQPQDDVQIFVSTGPTA